MTNHLAAELSPYLRQHAENPVDWRPWGPEALAHARAEQKPIFLSIGYAACHWCHVMAHESFADQEIAALLNERFVSVKVDREERPDVDQLYMDAVQALGARGGWPLSAFLTPDGAPFYGGTYWPPRSRGGAPGFLEVLRAVADAWAQRREQVLSQAAEVVRHIAQDALAAVGPGGEEPLSVEPLNAAEAALWRACDREYGGFGGAPKFPPALALRVLLRQWRRSGDAELKQIVCTTLDRMAAGGMYDQLGGGFHRYSVDRQWLTPHFEKMLYDNALLAVCYLEAWQAFGRPDDRRIIEETLDYVVRDMTDAGGGFHSSEDADSEGVEGRYYVWRPAEIEHCLGPAAAAAFCRHYDVTAGGNFEGRSILNCPRSLSETAHALGREPTELAAELAESRRRLLSARQRRTRPGRDDKVLSAWNGLMIDALARAGAALARPDYVQAAARAAQFVLREMRDAEGRLQRCWRAGETRVGAFLDDYAALAEALTSLYEADFNEAWLTAALALVEQIESRFADPATDGFFYTADDAETPLVRKKDAWEGSVPSGTSLTATVLVRLGTLCRRADLVDRGRRLLASHREVLEQASAAMGQMLLALDFCLVPCAEITVCGGGDDADRAASRTALADLARRFAPHKTVAFRDHRSPRGPLDALFADKPFPAVGPTVYLCQAGVCQAPAEGAEAVRVLWDALSAAPAADPLRP